MGVEKQLTEELPTTTKLNKSHSVDIYRPPPLRRSKIKSLPCTITSTESVFKNEKSDQSIPIQEKQQVKENHNRQQQPGNSNENSSIGNNVTTMITNEQQQQQQQQQRRRERRPDRAVYIPRARRSQTTPPTVVNCVQSQQHQQQQESQKQQDIINAHHLQNESVIMKPSTVTIASTNVIEEINNKCNINRKIKNKKDRKLQINQNELIKTKDFNNSEYCDSNNSSLNHSMSDNENQKTPIMMCDNYANTSDINLKTNKMQERSNDCCNSDGSSNNLNSSNLLKIEDVGNEMIDSLLKCDNDAVELQRASKEINRSNRRIIKQTFTSDILEIPENFLNKIQPTKTTIVENMSTKTKDENISPTKIPIEVISKTKNNSFTDNNTTTTTIDDDFQENENDDDWDSMFDENGDCLDPKIIQELSASVGKVKIELPKMDYTAFLTKQSILNEDEFPHVLEVSNFPIEFKTQDLLMIFSQYKESGFDIKWVDDTHALAVFSNSRVAAEVLTMGHPFVVLKPLADAKIESRLKAKKCATSLQPFRPRPETCAALARRLVTGALGVRLKTAAAERENEKRVLREAKERKLLAAKQRDDVWES